MGVNIIPKGVPLTMYNIFSIFISYFIVAFIYYKKEKRKINYKKLFGKASVSNVMIGLATGMGIFILQQLTYRIFIPTNTTVGSNVQLLQNMPAIFMILIAVIIAPIVEELFFRGFFYEITDNIKTSVYCINSAFLFSLLHLQNLESPLYAIYNLSVVFMSGFLFAFIYRKTQWIGTNIIAHATANGIAIFLIILFG
jgi:abortive infection protein